MRSVKYENIYLHSYQNGLELYKGLKEYFEYYNSERRHQGLAYSTPPEMFFLLNYPVNLGGQLKRKNQLVIVKKLSKQWGEAYML